MKVTSLSNTLTVFEQGLGSLLAVDTTSSETTCAPMMVIFARGTTEPGNVGLVTGPPFFDALEAMMGADAVGVQGVEYSASITGFLQGGDAAGSAAMANMVENTAQNCPNAKIVMSGYSQGCQLVHNAAAMLPASTMAKVNSVVLFGDPNDGKPVAGADAAKTMVICHATDNICDGGDLILVEHLTYSRDAVQAAAFAASRAKA
ncbi:cutinase [Rhexocercosporidium sp. MPI-PUGE-AT-0058]|nr:cutinase [Rhexocercosporidium sp. MPI-PUGE-AT-0058]